MQERSRELKLPLERIYACYVKEQLAMRLAGSAEGKRFLLKNPRVLSVYESAGSQRLNYCYALSDGETFTKADFSKDLKQILKWEQETNIEWSWRSLMKEDYLCVELLADLDGMKMPLELDVYPRVLTENLADEYGIRLMMENDNRATIYVYSGNEQLFEDLGEVFSKLELMGDMSVYERIYDILGSMSFEGRQVWQRLEEFCREKGIGLDEVRYEQMQRYRTYPYLQKKWKSYLKTQGRKVPSWEDVYGRIWDFLSPPWEASRSGLIYLGTWIPDIRRYLD
jgi:hypothetical protein